jgi:Xaa-Pro aminopeptidase
MEERMPKTPTQVAAIEKTQRAVEAAFSEVVAYLCESKTPTSEEAHAIIDRVLREHGCESPEGNIVACGPQSAEPHERGTGPLLPGMPIVIDIYPRSAKSGYFADMTRTVCLGEPPETLQQMYDVVLGAQELALSMLRPGAVGGDVQSAVERFFVGKGFETSGKGTEFRFAEGFVHGLGHGVGLEVHEVPRIGRESVDVLQEGDVVTVEPGLYYANIGGARLEDMALITKDGCRNLTKSEKTLVL